MVCSVDLPSNAKKMNSSEKITQYINGINDWRGERLFQLRKLINEAAPETTEVWKWICPIWERNGLICGISAFKSHVKLNFLQGASLEDPQGLFNSGLDSKSHRSINFAENDAIDEPAIKSLVRAAVAQNGK